MKKWIRIPGPGEFRGEGKWTEFDYNSNKRRRDEYDYYKETGYLPTHEGDTPPVE